MEASSGSTPKEEDDDNAADVAMVESSLVVSSSKVLVPTSNPRPSTTTTTTPITAVTSENDVSKGNNNNNYGDIYEQTLGITEYLSREDGTDEKVASSSSSSSSYGFSGVVKARYSDFLVHEIHLDGICARLTSTTIPSSSSSSSSSSDPIVPSVVVPTNPIGTPIIAGNNKVLENEVDPSNVIGTSSTNDDPPPTTTTIVTQSVESVPPSSSVPLSVSSSDLVSQLGTLINNYEIAQTVMTMLESHTTKDGQDDPSTTTTTSNDEIDEANSKINGGDNMNDINNNNNNKSKSNNKDSVPKFVTLPPLEKIQRTMVHEWVRKSLSAIGRADTLDGQIRIWHVLYEKEMPNYQTFGTSNDTGSSAGRNSNHNTRGGNSNKKVRKNWPVDRPDYLQFVLYKENLDTTTATRELCQRGGRGSSSSSKTRIGYAGMKDKRGITSQFCTLYRTTPEQIVTGKQQQQQQQQQGGTDSTAAVAGSGGGGNTKQRGCSVVQVGNFQYVSTEIQLGMLKGNRFDIILRHVQTFQQQNGMDIPILDRDQQRNVLETAAQAMKEKGFINYYGTQRFGKFNDTHLVGIQVLKGNFREAVNILLSPKPDDRPDVAQARLEWDQRFKYGENKENERTAARQVLKKFNRFMTAETAIVQCLLRHPMEYRRAFGCIPKNLRMMFIHAVQSLIWNRAASYRIRSMDRTTVLVGDLVFKDKESPSSSSSSAVHVVSETDVNENKYTMEDIVIPLVGNKTVYPTNAVGGIIKTILLDIDVTMDLFKKIQDRDLVVNGDYRKVICRPHDLDYKIQEYYDPLQPLLQTDLMKLRGIDISIEPKKENETTKLAMIVGFTLPSSSYATIALRELMKRPTSNEFQKELKLE